MLCTVFGLYYRGALLRAGHPFYMVGWPGLLTVAHGQDTRTRHGVLRHVESSEEVLRLYDAEIEKVAGGGVLVLGQDMTFRGTKSKGESSPQAWWCIPAGGQIVPPPRLPPRPERTQATW